MPKLTLDQSWIYAGKHYGPGEVEIDDEEAYKAIKAKMEAAAKAAKAEAALAAPSEAAEEETQAANRAAEKKSK